MPKFSFLNPKRVFDLKYIDIVGNVLKLLEILPLVTIAFESEIEKPEQLHFQDFCGSACYQWCQGIKWKINDQSCLNKINNKAKYIQEGGHIDGFWGILLFFVFLSFEVTCTHLFPISLSLLWTTENHDIEAQPKEEIS